MRIYPWDRDKVDISVMPDQNKLILANASGDAPDVAASINYSIPFELGISSLKI